MEYAARLKILASQLTDEVYRNLIPLNPCLHEASVAPQSRSFCASQLFVIMQVNLVEAAAAAGGWKGLMNDPDLDGSFQINRGFCLARQLLLDINRLGLPTGCECLDTITPQFVADLLSWAVVGERTCASRAHRELASGLSMPVGFVKDSVRDAIRGGERVALDAVRASGAPHAFLSCSKQGVAGIVETTGNRDCHVIVPAEQLNAISAECAALRALELPARVLIKCSAAESVPYSQAAHLKIVNTVASRVSTGTGAEGGSDEILGVLILSSLLGGRQELPIVGSLYANGQDGAARNVLTTEPCMDWFSTAQAMEALAAAVRHRRAVVSKKPRLS